MREWGFLMKDERWDRLGRMKERMIEMMGFQTTTSVRLDGLVLMAE